MVTLILSPLLFLSCERKASISLATSIVSPELFIFVDLVHILQYFGYFLESGVTVL